ncbi:MAG: class I SAM-dependent methyltransferase [Oscillospiraceae bacterium]
MLDKISKYLHKPALYAPGTGDIWEDEHISKGMLEAHLNPDVDSASRKHEFMDRSARWISSLVPPSDYPALLDLGCGPGLYSERFYSAGYTVTGVDISPRSIAYAKEQAALLDHDIDYRIQDYLALDEVEQYDVITLIYCNYPVFSVTDRLALAKKVYRALRKGGKFLLDVFTPAMRREESHTWYYCPEANFFSEKPYLCLDSVYQYGDEDETELRQNIVVTDDGVQCYNVWDHFFTKEKLLSEMKAAGFHMSEFYGDVAGAPYNEAGDAICGVFTK